MPGDAGTKYTDRKTEEVARRLKRLYKEAERDLDEKISDFWTRHKKRDEKHRAEVDAGILSQDDYEAWLRGQVFQGNQWSAKRAQIVRDMIDVDKIAQRIVDGEKQNIFIRNANYVGYDLEHGMAVDIGFELYDSATVARLIKDDPKLLPALSPKKVLAGQEIPFYQNIITNSITQGIIQGEGIQKILSRITSQCAERAQSAALRDVRTAYTGAQNAGRIEGMRQSKSLGIQVRKQWMATFDFKTRPAHRELDGQIAEVDEPFRVDGERIMYPGDPKAKGYLIYNCRCTLGWEYPEYPSSYERRDNITGETVRGMNYKQWADFKTAQATTGIRFMLPTPKRFKNDFDVAKATLPPGGEWRVDDTHTIEDYEHDKLLELPGGSVVAVAPDGNIISVCKNQDGNDRGSDLLKIAIANGGDRLDAFGRNLYKFYTKNGFEPVSWTPFNEEYAPHDWVKGRDDPEPVIFYRYTGKTTSLTYEEFLTNTPPMAEYDDAMAIRDKMIDDSH